MLWDRVHRSDTLVAGDGGGIDGKVEVIGAFEYSPGPIEEMNEVVASETGCSTTGRTFSGAAGALGSW